VDTKLLANQLESFARSRPNAEARVKVAEALSSKWEGVQVAAVKVLCAWGDETSLLSAKEALADFAGREARWSGASTMAKAIAPHLCPADSMWVANTLTSRANVENIVALRFLADSSALAELLPLLEKALSQAVNDRRRKALSQVYQYAQNRRARPEV
jgi:hypothetical protein